MSRMRLTSVRPKLLIMFLAGAAVVMSGSLASSAESPYAIRDPKVPRNLSPAARARYQRAAAIKRNQDVKKFILDNAKGEKQNGKTK